ncbi:sugar phosphate isomerase/epimerase family protein [Haloferula chungangensis]|uniref:Sugar phosphate isomerase/epimerase family protein n=1 Tax=Haloferula chungangensis TaxID=1048331 RepID=A0ABW2L142_9BACT
MNLGLRTLICLFCTLTSTGSLAASPLENNPFGVFDFNLRGKTPAEQIASLDGLGYDGLAMQLNTPQRLRTLEAYQAARPDFPLLVGFMAFNLDQPKKSSPAHLDRVLAALAAREAPLWIIVQGPKDRRDDILKLLRKTVYRCEKAGVQPVLYPHDNTAIESAEEALEILNELDRPEVKLTFHLCHELRAGNGDRLDEIAEKIAPHLVLASISGADAKMQESPPKGDWSEAIKPLDKGDYDAARFLRALAAVDYKGPIILHTFGLQKEPASHYRRSAEAYRKMIAKLNQK